MARLAHTASFLPQLPAVVLAGVVIVTPAFGRNANTHFSVGATVVTPCHAALPSIDLESRQHHVARLNATAISVSCTGRMPFAVNVSPVTTIGVARAPSSDAPPGATETAPMLVTSDLEDSTNRENLESATMEGLQPRRAVIVTVSY
jgi:hypothetical protein